MDEVLRNSKTVDYSDLQTPRLFPEAPSVYTEPDTAGALDEMLKTLNQKDRLLFLCIHAEIYNTLHDRIRLYEHHLRVLFLANDIYKSEVKLVHRIYARYQGPLIIFILALCHDISCNLVDGILRKADCPTMLKFEVSMTMEHASLRDMPLHEDYDLIMKTMPALRIVHDACRIDAIRNYGHGKLFTSRNPRHDLFPPNWNCECLMRNWSTHGSELVRDMRTDFGILEGGKNWGAVMDLGADGFRRTWRKTFTKVPRQAKKIYFDVDHVDDRKDLMAQARSDSSESA